VEGIGVVRNQKVVDQPANLFYEDEREYRFTKGTVERHFMCIGLETNRRVWGKKIYRGCEKMQEIGRKGGGEYGQQMEVMNEKKTTLYGPFREVIKQRGAKVGGIEEVD